MVQPRLSLPPSPPRGRLPHPLSFQRTQQEERQLPQSVADWPHSAPIAESASAAPPPCTGRYRYAASTGFFAELYDRLLTLREWQAKLFDQRNILNQFHHPPHFRTFKTSATMHHTSVICLSPSRPYAPRARGDALRAASRHPLGPDRAGASSSLIGCALTISDALPLSAKPPIALPQLILRTTAPAVAASLALHELPDLRGDVP